jgi:pSer/pThr/pTyr-binding forkhead associated (FHA) protein
MAAENTRVSGAASGGRNGFIRVESGFYEGLEWALGEDPIIIGRGRKADLTLSEPTISRTHVRVGREDGGLYMEDLGSTNGTQVNGRREDRAPLRDGDELRMGKLSLRVKLPGEKDA